MLLSREYLGKSIQFFSGHGWWKNTSGCSNLAWTINVVYAAKKGQLNAQLTFFSECPALADVRRELFNDSYQTQLMGQQSLCQVSELALCGSILDLFERTDQNHSNICSTGWALSKMVNYGGNGLRAVLGGLILGNFIA